MDDYHLIGLLPCINNNASTCFVECVLFSFNFLHFFFWFDRFNHTYATTTAVAASKLCIISATEQLLMFKFSQSVRLNVYRNIKFVQDFESVDRRYSACSTLSFGASSMFSVHKYIIIEIEKERKKKEEDEKKWLVPWKVTSNIQNKLDPHTIYLKIH